MVSLQPEHEIAREFLHDRGHRVEAICRSTGEYMVDSIAVSDLGLIAIAQTYRREWRDYLIEIRANEIIEEACGVL